MSGLEALLLGLVQGLTEFLPVSSSGHLVILQVVLQAEREGLLFEVAVHVATLGSVLVYYRRRVVGLSVGVLGGSPDALRYVGKLALATLPAVLAVWLAGGFLEKRFDSARSAALCLLVTGGILWTTRLTIPRAWRPEPGWGAALLIGCGQALAILPGISRSGTTVAVALALGIAPAAAAEFSFLMSVIAIAGAGVRVLPDLAAAPPEEAMALLGGAAVALLSGIAAIWTFLRLLRARAFHGFAYYTWAAGSLTLLWLSAG